MRILIAVHGYPPTHSAGAERRTERTARAMASRGHEVRVLCVETTSADHTEVRWSDSLQNEVHVRRIAYNPIIGRVPWNWSYHSPQLGAALEDLLAHWTPDVLHLFSGYLLTAAMITIAAQHQIPSVISLTDYWWLCHRTTLLRANGQRCNGPEPTACARCLAESSRRFQLLRQIAPVGSEAFWHVAGHVPRIRASLGFNAQVQRTNVMKATLRQADALIAPSHFLAAHYLRYGAPIERLHIWRQGVDLNYCPMPVQSSILRVGFMGQIKPHKGLHLLLEAWGQLRGEQPRELLIYGSDAGDESYGQRMRAIAQKLPTVNWRGTFRGSEVWDVLTNLDVLVIPSRWAENSPNSMLEAQAMGVPLVGSDLGGVAELIQHEVNGLRFATDDAADLARQLQRLLDEPGLLTQLRMRPLPFQSVEVEMDQIEQLYNNLTGEDRTKAKVSAVTNVAMSSS